MNLILKWTVLIIFSILVLFSQSYAQFGKNKVQYEDFHWKYIESKHFDVYYTTGSKYLAEFTAIKAEDALLSIQLALNYKLSNRVIIVVYDSHNEFQQTNVVSEFMPEGVGGVTEMLKNRVVVPFQGNYSQLRHVIHHELVHAVLNDMIYGGTFQSALSMGGFQMPIWMNEGLAEYLSIGGLDIQTDMFMRDLTISEQLPPLQELGGYLAYRCGQTFFCYIADKYGKEKVGDLINRLKITHNVEAAFLGAFNEKLEDFSEKWQKEMKKYFWPDLTTFDDPDNFATSLTDHKKNFNFYNSSPAISPNGDKMAYIADKDGVFRVFIRSIENKEKVEELVSSFRHQDFEQLNLLTPGISWNPKGTELAISAKAGGEDAIFIVDVKSGDYEKIKFGFKSISSVAWSPNGFKLAFIASKLEKSDLFVYDIKSKQLNNLTNDIFSEYVPVWSSDSHTIYFVSEMGDNFNAPFNSNNFKMWDYDLSKSDIYSINIETRNIKRLTFDEENTKTSIAVSPDNKKLLYTSENNGIGNIYELNLATGKAKPKTNSLNGITQLSLSPDGSKLLFTVLVNAGYDIFMIRHPFDKEFNKTELPLTKLKQKEFDQNKLVQAIGDNIEQEKKDSGNKLIGYGNYDIEFGRQQVVRPNPDVQSKDDVATAIPVKGEPISDTTFVEHEYKLKFSPDVVLGNPGYSTYWGFQGVTQMLFTDVLGDHQIYLLANLLLDIRNSTFLASYNYLPEVIDYQVSVWHNAGFVYNWTDASHQYTNLFRFRNWGAGLSASYPFDLFNRVEWGLQWMNVSKENVDNPDQLSVSRMLFVPEARLVHDDVLWGWYAPIQGTRYYLGFKGTPKLTKDGIGFMTVKADIRHYIPLGDYLSIAARATAAASFGPNPQNFFLGGTENWINASFSGDQLPFDQPEDFAFMEIEMPLRGFPINAMRGSKFFVTNFELRFPLFRALLAGPVPILLQGVQACLFYDMGGAWNSTFNSIIIDQNGDKQIGNLLMSTGIGLRTYLFGIPIKMDVAWENLYYGWSQPEYLFSLGLDF